MVMSEAIDRNELQDRLQVIESMIAEGRRKTESWGWTFVLWGVIYYVAIFWSTWSVQMWSWPTSLFAGYQWAWPITTFSGAALTILIGTRTGKGQPNTAIGMAITSIWSAMGISMILLFPALGLSGRIDHHSFIAIVAAMLGMANGACGLILKWRAELACALVWWATSVAVCFGSEQQVITLFLIAIFLAQIVFGIYAMRLDARRMRGVCHA
jgi:hypothetical protein